MTFTVDDATMEKIYKWIDTLPKLSDFGASGGPGVTYIFTPLNLGTVFKVKYHAADGDHELDLTDYDEW